MSDITLVYYIFYLYLYAKNIDLVGLAWSLW